MDTPQFDIIVWGATGLTGARVSEYIVESILPHQPDLKLAIAGRNKQKLQSVLKEIASVNPKAANVPILIGDASDQASVDAIVKQSKVIISAAGPYAVYGTPVVDACVRFGRHYVDITGEMHWVGQIIEKYHDAAKDTGAIIVPFCGFDSIPSDIGVYFAVQQLKEKFNVNASQVTGTVYSAKSAGPSGGTLASGLNMIEELGAVGTIKMMSDRYYLNPKDKKFGPDADRPGKSFFYDSWIGKWQGSWVMAPVNTRVVRRSQALMGYPCGNFGYTETMSFPNVVVALFATIFQTIGNFAMFFPPVRFIVKKLLDRFMPPGSGPAKEVCKDPKKTNFLLKFHAEGGGHQVLTHYRGLFDPGYWATCCTVSLSALLLLKPNKLPSKEGGVFTPAAAFGQALIDSLEKHDVAYLKLERAE